MNLKKSLIGAVAGLALIGSIAAPVAQVSAGENGDSANAEIVITNGGTFDFDFTNDLNLSTYDLNADNAWQTNEVTGSLGFLYTDSKAYRGGFTNRVVASDFHGVVNSGLNTIPVSGFVIVSMPNPVQQYCCRGNNGIAGISNSADGTTATTTGAADWGAGVSFNTTPYIHLSLAGRGTGTTSGQLNVKLSIPSDTKADTYRTQVTSTIVFTAP